ncbi:Hypothetical predicted protein [Xyrichtys novacula]|uniref:Uncharacterized protein n=1 Tax=Xyrichtys novacula TaxID=13765 RepID=A0AAV1GD49_XYRNO|nr:Hypothetical predicted protein [Xyrichtys novacula]
MTVDEAAGKTSSGSSVSSQLGCYLSAVSADVVPGQKSLNSSDSEQPDLVEQLARCFPSPPGKAPGVKFRGSGRAADIRSPRSSPQSEHSMVKIADHFGLPSTRFPPLCRLGKEGGAPASQWMFNSQRES